MPEALAVTYIALKEKIGKASAHGTTRLRTRTIYGGFNNCKYGKENYDVNGHFLPPPRIITDIMK